MQFLTFITVILIFIGIFSARIVADEKLQERTIRSFIAKGRDEKQIREQVENCIKFISLISLICFMVSIGIIIARIFS